MDKVTLDPKEGQSDQEKILYLGCDIGSASHAVAIVNQEGKVLERLGKVYNNRKGFEFLLKKIDHWAKRTGADRICLGFEPTGHYWKTIAHYLVGHGVEVFFIKTTAVKAMRELTDSTPSKNDKRDAVTLAHLTREHKTLKSPIPEGIWRELRELSKHRETLKECRSALLLRLRAWIDTFFPELAGLFSSMDAVGLRRLLEEAPSPKDVTGKGISWLTLNLKRWMKKGKTAEEKAKKIMEGARESVGLPLREGDRERLSSLLRLLECHNQEMKTIEGQMEGALYETGYAEILISFPGLGVVSAATLLGELGNPTNYENAGQWVSMAGIDPSEWNSGKRERRRKISKKGRPLLRTTQYFMALNAIQNCTELKAYYHRKKEDIESARLDLEPKQLVFAVAIKQTRILFAMCRDRRMYILNYLKLKRAA
jgi:transposase